MSRGTRGFPYLTLKTKVWGSGRAKYRERLGGGDALRASFCVKMRVEDDGMRGGGISYLFLAFPVTFLSSHRQQISSYFCSIRDD